MKPSRFKETKQFEGCLYQGLFAGSVDERWWSSCIDDVLFAEARKRDVGVGPPWKIGPQVFGLRKEEQPVCEVCGELFPEFVARDSANRTRETPVHQRCSRQDPDRDFVPFFLEERVFDQG
jgi:hypothetical protein